MDFLREFEQIASTPEYQDASDQEKDNIRQNLFYREIAPTVPASRLDGVKNRWDELTAPVGDPTAGVAEDIARSGLVGLTAPLADTARFFTGGRPNWVSKPLQRFNEEVAQGRSPTAIQAERDTGLEFDSETGDIQIKPDSSLYGLLMQTAGAGGSLVSSVGMGGGLGKAVGMAGKAMAGTTKAADAAIKASNFSKARQLLGKALQREQTANQISFGLTGAGMIGGGTGAQAYEETLQRTGSVALAEQAGLKGTATGAALGAATMGLAGPIEQRLLMGRGGATRLGNVAKGAGTEAVQEFAESGGQEYLAGKAMQDVGLEVEDLTGRSLAVGLHGGLLGSLAGGALGGASKPQKTYTQEDYDGAISANNLEATRIEGELKTGELTDDQRANSERQLKDIYRSVAIDEIARAAAKPATTDQDGEQPATEPQDTVEPGERRIPAGQPASWLPEDIQQRYQDSVTERRSLVSQLRRASQNGIEASVLAQYEDRIKEQDERINTNRLAVNNAGNQKFFADQQDFYGWLNRAAQGANWEQLALMELDARKGQPVNWPAMAQMEQDILQKGDIRDRARVLELNNIVQAVEQRMAKSRIDTTAGREEARQAGESALQKRQKREQQKREQQAQGANRTQRNIEKQAEAKAGRQAQRQETEAQQRTEAEEQRREIEAEQAKAAQIEKQRKQQQASEAHALTQQIDREHWTEKKIGSYHVWAGESEKFAVSGTTKPESGRMNKLGGFYNKQSGSWEFPKTRRAAVEKALNEFAKKPQPKEKVKKKRVHLRTITKKVRRAQAKGKPKGAGSFRAMGGVQAAAKPEPKAFSAEDATHVWTNPETGRDEYLINNDTDWYTDQTGEDRYLTKRDNVRPVERISQEQKEREVEERRHAEEEKQYRAKEEAKREAESERAGKAYAEAKEKERKEREAADLRRKKQEKENEEFEQRAKDRKAKETADRKEFSDTRKAIGVLADELRKTDELKPVKEPVPWSDIGSKVPDRAGNEKARSVPWARTLEDAYRKTDGWDSELYYADENVAIFKNKENELFVVKQPDAYRYVAWATLSGQDAHSPDSYGDSYLRTIDQDSSKGYGTRYSVVDSEERPAWTGGWRGAVTRPVKKIEGASERAEKKKPDNIKAGDAVPIVGRGTYNAPFYAPWDGENGTLTITANHSDITIKITTNTSNGDVVINDFKIPRDKFFQHINDNSPKFFDDILDNEVGLEYSAENAQYDTDGNFARENFHYALRNFSDLFGNGRAPLTSRQIKSRISKWMGENNIESFSTMVQSQTKQMLKDISKGDMSTLSEIEYYLSNKDVDPTYPAMDIRIESKQRTAPIATRTKNGTWMRDGRKAIDQSELRPTEKPAVKPRAEEPAPKASPPKPTGPLAKVTVREMGTSETVQTLTNADYIQVEARSPSKRMMTKQEMVNLFKSQYGQKNPDMDYLIVVWPEDVVSVWERDSKNIKPPRGWRDDGTTIRDFATSVGITTKGKTPKAITKDIDEFLAKQKENRQNVDTSEKPVQKTEEFIQVPAETPDTTFDPMIFSNTEGDLSTLTLDNIRAIAESQPHGIKSLMRRIGASPNQSPEDAYQSIQTYLAEQAEAASTAPETTVTPAETESTSVASPEKQPEPAKETAPKPETARQTRIRRRAGKMIEIDDELEAESAKFAAELRKGMSTTSAGVDPVLLAKFLQHGIKTSSLLVQKGAIKFVDWADNMLAIMERQGFEPEQIAPYLKRLYGATQQDEELGDIADQMDDPKTVRKFDINTLLEEETEEGIPPEIVEDEIYQSIASENGTFFDEYKQRVLDTADDHHAELAITTLVKKAGADLRTQAREENIEGALEKYGVWVKTADKQAVIDNLLDNRKDYRSQLKTAGQTEANAEAHPKKLTEALYDNLNSDTPITNNNQLKAFLAERLSIPTSKITPEQVKKAQEAMEVALVMQARDTVAEGVSEQDTFEKLVKQYQAQPLLNVRSSTSMENQAYSTPSPLAYLSGNLAGITQNTTNYEPTAGNAMLLINGSVENSTVNELEDLRVKHLKELGYSPTQKDATDFVPSKKHDAVITNPPFGTMKNPDGSVKMVRVQGYQIKKLEHLIAAKALEAMKDDGKASIIIGANRKEGEVGAMDKVFFNWLYKHYNVTDHVEINGDLYKRQGAGWPVRIITVEGRRVSGNIIPGLRDISPKAGTIPRLNDWDSIYAHYQKVLDARRQRADNNREDSADSGQQETATGLDELQGESGSLVGRTGQPAPEGGGRTGTSGRAGKPDGSTDSGRGPGESQQRSERTDGNRSGNPAAGQGQVARNTKADATGDRGHTGRTQDNGAATLDGSPVQPAVTKSGYQTTYQTASNGFNENVLTPVSMAEATNKALQKITDEYGSVDSYVMDRLQYPDKKALFKAFMGLQVDTVAAAIYNAENKTRSKAIIIADQTGVGKGRQAAAMLRYARLQGRIPVFMTEKPNLFTDMYDDLADIGEHDIKPFILNKEVFIKGKDGQKLFANVKSKHRGVLNDLAKQDGPGLPNGANAIFMTYSQIDTDNVQRQMLDNMIKQNKMSWVLDEAHTAAGERKKKVKGGERITRAGFIYNMIDQGHVLYLSATYAKRPDNMPIYYRTDIMEAVDKEEDLVTALASGGVPLQTVMANMLAESGQLFRRERSFEGISVETVVDYVNSTKHRQQYDEVIKGLQAVTYADIVFENNYFKHHKDQAEEQGAGAVMAGNKASSSVSHNNFTSVIHNYIRQLLMAMKVDNVVNNAIALNKQGIKVVIALENTMGSFMEETARESGLRAGDVYSSDYRDILLRALERTRRISNKDTTGDSEVEQVSMAQLDEITRGAYRDAENIINALDITNLPSSPIDYIRYKLEAAGINTGEITGRNLTINYAGDDPVLSSRPAEEINDRRGTVDKFNDGRVDALILNAAGSTGLSIHASERFTDQRPRKMLVMQASLNINTMMQMLGRINRTGQLELPSYELMALDLPAEKRPQSVLSRKMASLNANTSANSKSDTSIDAPDLMNKYGSKVVATYMNENPDVTRKLNMLNSMVEEDKEPPSELASKFTGRLSLLSVKEQEDVYAEIETAYMDLIKYLDSTGQNELNPQTLDLDARIDKSKVIYEGKAPGTVFGGNTTLHKVDSKYQGTPPTPQDVEKSLNKSLKDTTPKDIASDILEEKAADDYLTTIESHRASLVSEWEKLRSKSGLTGDLQTIVDFLSGNDEYGEQHKLTKKFTSYLDRINASQEAEHAYRQSRSKTQGAVEEFLVGNHYKLDLGDELATGVVTGIKNTHKTGQGNSYALSKTKVTFSVNSGIRQVEIPLTRLLIQGDGAVVTEKLRSQGTNRLDDLFKPMGLLGSGERRENRYIATGNLISGLAKLQGGRIVNFTDNTNKTHKGILMPKKFGAEHFHAASGNYLIVRESAIASRLLKEHGKELGMLGLSFPGMKGRIYQVMPGFFEISVPRSNKDPVTTSIKFNKSLRDAMGTDFYGSGQIMKARFSETKLDNVLNNLIPLSTLQLPKSQKNIYKQAGGKVSDATKEGFEAVEDTAPALQRRDKKKGKGISRSDAVKTAREFAGKLKKGRANISVELFKDHAEYIARHGQRWPEDRKRELLDDKAPAFVVPIFDQGANNPPTRWRVAVFPGVHGSVKDLQASLRHETFAHVGLDTLEAGDKQNILNRVKAARNNKTLKPIYDEIAELYKDRSDDIIAEEVIGRVAETSPNLFNRVLHKVRLMLQNAMRKVGLIDDTMTRTDITELLSTLQKRVEAGASPQYHVVEKLSRRAALSGKETRGQTEQKSVRKVMSDLLNRDKEAVDTFVANNKGNWRNLKGTMLGALGGRQIADIYTPLFKKFVQAGALASNPVTAISDLMQSMQTLRNTWVGRAESMDQRWARLARQDKRRHQALAKTMYETTLTGIDPRLPYDNETDLDDYNRVQALWNSLSDTAQQLYTDVEQHYRDQYKATTEALIKRAEGLFGPREAHSAIATLKKQMGTVKGPYFPLMRFGDFYIKGIDADGKEYREHFEKEGEMLAARQQLIDQGMTISESGKIAPYEGSGTQGVMPFVVTMEKRLIKEGDSKFSRQQKMQFLDELHQAALSMLPDTSAAKRSMHRRSVAGYDLNARRAFNATSLTGANRLARISYGWQVEDTIKRMREATEGNEQSGALTTEENITAQNVITELKKRHDLNMNPQTSPWSAWATNFAFMSYLGGSVGAGLVNMTQTPMLAIPILGGRYGYRRTSRYMAKASADYFSKGKRKFEDANDFMTNAWFTLEGNTGIEADARQALQNLIDDGTIETTQASTMAGNAGVDLDAPASANRDWYNTLTRSSGLFFHNAEVANRQVTALTAYRLWRDDLLKRKPAGYTLTSDDIKNGAIFARKATFDAHFDYSNYNRPRYMKGNWPRVFLIFKQYSQNMTYLLGKTFYDATKNKDLTAEQRYTARKQMAGILGMSTIGSGLMGLPGLSLLTWFAEAVGGDEDDPFDAEVAFRNWAAEMFGKDIAHALSKGVANGFLGIDLHARVKMADMFYQSNNRDLSPRDEAMSTLATVAGPFFSQMINMWVGLNEVIQGDGWRGMERIMPKAIRDGMKTVRYNDEGLIDAYGNVMIEDFSLYEKAWRTIGIGSARESEAWDARGAVKGAQSKIARRKSTLLNDYDRAMRNNDQAAVDRVMTQIGGFNAARRINDQPSLMISGKTLSRSIKERERRRRKAEGGIYLPQSQLGLRDLTTGYAY